MRSKMIIFTLIISLFIFPLGAAAQNHTMSWYFKTFNRPNNSQVALNQAEKQRSMIEKDDDPIDMFQRGLERRLYSNAQSKIVDAILDDAEIPGDKINVGDLEISVIKDGEEVTLDIINTETGEYTTINYSSDEWLTDYNVSEVEE